MNWITTRAISHLMIIKHLTEKHEVDHIDGFYAIKDFVDEALEDLHRLVDLEERV